MILTHLVLLSFLAGAGGGAEPVTETPSGGWERQESHSSSNKRRHPFHDETDSEREARIYAERVRLGIIEPDPPKPAAVEAADATIERVPATLLSPDPGLAVDLAGLYAGAWLDQEIRRHFELQDDDDAAVLLLAIAALH